MMRLKILSSGGASGGGTSTYDFQAGRCSKGAANDPELQTVIDAWGRLPVALKAGILAMVKAANLAGGR